MFFGAVEVFLESFTIKTHTLQRNSDSIAALYCVPTLPGNDVDHNDILDYGEQFDQLEAARVMEKDPDSLAFFQAQKSMRTTFRSNRNQIKAGLRKKRH